MSPYHRNTCTSSPFGSNLGTSDALSSYTKTPMSTHQSLARPYNPLCSYYVNSYYLVLYAWELSYSNYFKELELEFELIIFSQVDSFNVSFVFRSIVLCCNLGWDVV